MRLEISPLMNLPEFGAGDDLATALGEAAQRDLGGLLDHDVVVVTSKVVSKVEGRVVSLADLDTPPGREKAAIVEAESVRLLRRRGDLYITQTRHGFVCANAGVDISNLPAGVAALLPVDPDRSARRLRAHVSRIFGLDVLGVVVSDTFGRPWRRGLTDVAIGSAGFAPVEDLRGETDTYGRPLDITEIATADEIAAAADLVLGKTRHVPAAVVRGLSLAGNGSAQDLVRPPREDLFR